MTHCALVQQHQVPVKISTRLAGSTDQEGLATAALATAAAAALAACSAPAVLLARHCSEVAKAGENAEETAAAAAAEKAAVARPVSELAAAAAAEKFSALPRLPLAQPVDPEAVLQADR